MSVPSQLGALVLVACATLVVGWDDGAPRSQRRPVVYKALNHLGGIDLPSHGAVRGGAHPYVVRPPGPLPDDWAEPHCRQVYRLFLPRGERPEHGWPVVVNLDLGGYASSSDYRIVHTYRKGTESRLAAFLEHGFAVINALATPSAASFPCREDGPDEETVEGGGLFHPPGFVPSGADVASYDTWRQPMSEKDAVMLIQHVRHNAGRSGHLLGPLYRGPDGSTKIAVTGTSSAAMSLMWAALGPERRDDPPFAGAGGQYAESTRPDAAILIGGAVWWPLFDGNVGRGYVHFGVLGDEGTQARKLRQANPAELVANSALHYDATCDDPIPLYMSYAEPSACTDYDGSDATPCTGIEQLDLNGGGLAGGSQGFGRHPAWSGFAWKIRHPETRLVLRDEQAWEQRDDDDIDGDGEPDTIDAVLIPSADEDAIERASHLDMIEWLTGVFGP